MDTPELENPKSKIRPSTRTGGSNENQPPPIHGRGIALPLSLTRQIARTFAENPLACIARTDDGRPIILAHDVQDRRRLLASLPTDAAEHITVHAGHYVETDGQVIQPAKGQYILLAAAESPNAARTGRIQGGPSVGRASITPAGDNGNHDCLLVGFLPTCRREPHRSTTGNVRCGSYDITGRHEIIDIDNPEDPSAGSSFTDARGRADCLVANGDYWAVAVRRRGDATRRWAYFATESGAPAAVGASK